MPPSVIKQLPCGHDVNRIRIKGQRALCLVCKSFCDLYASKNGFTYDNSYPATRNHFDPAVGSAKVRSFESWLKTVQTEIAGLVVCEVGFGGGQILQYLNRHARAVWGIEAVEGNRHHAVTLGLPADHILSIEGRPYQLKETVDLWVFLDSFEHLTEPVSFMQWVIANSSPHSRILIVAPRADSLSARFLGKWWPHRVPEHFFHWSLNGLTIFLGGFGFKLDRSFFPWKRVSLPMVMSHIRHKFGWSKSPSVIEKHLPTWHVLFNIGEMGLLLLRDEIPTV